MSKRGLGRGLGALISKKPIQVNSLTEPAATEASPQTQEQGLTELPLELIVPSPWQPRTVFDEDKLDALAQSIREEGLVQPLVVRKREGKYELIAGERRFRAISLLGWKKAPACIMETSDRKMRELALVENLQRDDLNPIEIGVAYQALRQDPGLTHEQIATRLGVSRASVTNTLRLLDLPEEIKAFISSGKISAGHARAILSLPDGLSQIKLAKKIVEQGLSVRETERLVKPKNTQKKTTTEKGKPKEAAVNGLEGRLRDHLGTKVMIDDKNGKGRIVIEYYSHDDVSRILSRIGLPDDL